MNAALHFVHCRTYIPIASVNACAALQRIGMIQWGIDNVWVSSRMGMIGEKLSPSRSPFFMDSRLSRSERFSGGVSVYRLEHTFQPVFVHAILMSLHGKLFRGCVSIPCANYGTTDGGLLILLVRYDSVEIGPVSDKLESWRAY